MCERALCLDSRFLGSAYQMDWSRLWKSAHWNQPVHTKTNTQQWLQLSTLKMVPVCVFAVLMWVCIPAHWTANSLFPGSRVWTIEVGLYTQVLITSCNISLRNPPLCYCLITKIHQNKTDALMLWAVVCVYVELCYFLYFAPAAFAPFCLLANRFS